MPNLGTNWAGLPFTNGPSSVRYSPIRVIRSKPHGVILFMRIVFPSTNLVSVRNVRIALILCLFQLGCSHSPKYYLDKGNRFYSDGGYTDAVLNYKNSIKMDGNSAEVHYRLGLAELKLNDLPIAVQELRRATELAPGREDLMVELADASLVAYSSDARRPKVLYERIVDTADFLLKKNPGSFDGLRFRGDVLAIDGKLEEAAGVFRKANAIRPLEPKVILADGAGLVSYGPDSGGSPRPWRKSVFKATETSGPYAGALQSIHQD